LGEPFKVEGRKGKTAAVLRVKDNSTLKSIGNISRMLIDKFFEAAMARRRRILSMVPTGE
jgi:hypothetical protein